MGVGAGLYMYVVVVQKFTFAISSPDEFLSRFCPPPDVSASTSPRPYGPEGPNLAHLQSIVRSTVHRKQFANNRPKIGQNAKIANLALFRRGALYLWASRLLQFLPICRFLTVLQRQ